eukprot:14563612-Ditylum_brightwellii.AAC.1
MRAVCNYNTFLPQRRCNGLISEMQRLITHGKQPSTLMCTIYCNQETRVDIREHQEGQQSYPSQEEKANRPRKM